MTVAELIRELEKLPQDTPVLTEDERDWRETPSYFAVSTVTAESVGLYVDGGQLRSGESGVVVLR
jgi:hypothetical protein